MSLSFDWCARSGLIRIVCIALALSKWDRMWSVSNPVAMFFQPMMVVSEVRIPSRYYNVTENKQHEIAWAFVWIRRFDNIILCQRWFSVYCVHFNLLWVDFINLSSTESGRVRCKHGVWFVSQIPWNSLSACLIVCFGEIQRIGNLNLLHTPHPPITKGIVLRWVTTVAAASLTSKNDDSTFKNDLIKLMWCRIMVLLNCEHVSQTQTK